MDSIYDYLYTISYMKTAVSKLLEVLAKKIRFLARGNFTYADIAEANENIKNQLKLIEGLNFIMLNKFDQIINFQGMPGIYRAFQEDSQKETKSKAPPTVQVAPLAAPAEKQDVHTLYQDIHTLYVLKGAGYGTVSCAEDYYCGGLAIFHARISNVEYEKKRLYMIYSVKKGAKILVIISSPGKSRAGFSTRDGCIAASVEGEGMFIVKERYKPDVRLPCEYGFTVRLIPRNDGIRPAIIFGMAASTKNRTYMHESGDINSLLSRITVETPKSALYTNLK